MGETITSLIEKLEGAEVGNRELDCAMFQFDPMRAATGYWFADEKPGANPVAAHVPAVTTSLDAALALAERVLPGVRIVIDSACKETGKPAAGFVFGQTDERINGVMNDGSTLPLALCAAILRAQSEARPTGEDSPANEGEGGR